MADNSLILSASCNKWGAGLELPPGRRFVTCQLCGSRLEVRFSGGVAFTEVLEPGDDGARRIVFDLQLIKLQNELSRLDQEWNLERDRYRTYHRHSGSSLPSGGQTAMFVLVGLVVIAFGVFWTATASDAGAPLFMVFFGICFIGISIVAVIHACASQGQYTTAVDRYQSRRGELLKAIEQFENAEPAVSSPVPESASP